MGAGVEVAGVELAGMERLVVRFSRTVRAWRIVSSSHTKGRVVRE